MTRWTLRMLTEAGLFAACFAVAHALGPWSWWPLALVIGARMHALGEIGHMASHRLVTGRVTDDWRARVAFAPLAT
jgi:fatty acid desaturase